MHVSCGAKTFQTLIHILDYIVFPVLIYHRKFISLMCPLSVMWDFHVSLKFQPTPIWLNLGLTWKYPSPARHVSWCIHHAGRDVLCVIVSMICWSHVCVLCCSSIGEEILVLHCFSSFKIFYNSLNELIKYNIHLKTSLVYCEMCARFQCSPSW